MLEKTSTKKLSLKERKFLKHFIECGNKSEAARRAGYKHVNSAWNVLDREDVQMALEQMMDEKGLADGNLLNVIADGVKANKSISCNVIAKDGEGMKPANEMTKDFVDVPDHDARHKFTRLALELRGRLTKQRDGDGTTFNVQGNVNFIQAMIARAQEIR